MPSTITSYSGEISSIARSVRDTGGKYNQSSKKGIYYIGNGCVLKGWVSGCSTSGSFDRQPVIGHASCLTVKFGCWRLEPRANTKAKTDKAN